MIRRNILSAVGVCAALAVGIALGGGPLNDHHAAPAATTVSADPALRHTVVFGERWATRVSQDLYAGRLRGRRVAIVTLPGARRTTVQQLRAGIGLAKATVSARVGLTPALIDPNRKVAVETLSAQYARQSRGTIDPARPAYQRLGQMLGTALAREPLPWWPARQRHSAASAAAMTAKETLRTAKFASIEGARRPASLVLVVLGPSADPQIVAGLLRGLATKVTGIVVAGGSASAAHGALAGLRREKFNAKIMTVDGIDTAYGRASTLLGLVRQTRPRGGAYGASGIDGPVPLG